MPRNELVYVKKYIFKPSGNSFYVVLGSTGDHLTTKHFCTCGDFNFRRRPEGCRHMQALRRAIQQKSYKVYNFSDDEFSQVFKYELMEVVFVPR
ncbi:MAG: hypothetical protein QXY52_05120 [Conexivisphaerales archaeon]